MDRFGLLSRTAGEFAARLETVADDQWRVPTPCTEWDVRGLVNHLVTADTTSVRLLKGASRDEVFAFIGSDHLGGDPLAAFVRSAAEQVAAFRAVGALEMVVPHPAFDMPGSQLLDFRIGDTLLHTWDLARAIGGDEVLNHETVNFVWESLEPLAEVLPTTGAFGAGRSEVMTDSATLQDRLLDLSGRRP